MLFECLWDDMGEKFGLAKIPASRFTNVRWILDLMWVAPVN
jgi:hypothetical protein